MLDNYPPGVANDPDAPWNEKEIPTQHREVLVQALISFDINVEGQYNEDGEFEINNQSLYEEIDNYLNKDDVINYDIIDIE